MTKPEPEAKSPKTPKHRSPNYPACSLESAIAEAATLFSRMGRHLIGLDVALGYLGYKVTSSSGKLHLAALRAYDLLDVAKDQHGQKVKLSSTALDIVSGDYPNDHPSRLKAIKIAALAPKLHSELWEKWGANLPPDDEIRRFLIRERGFYDKSVGDFIAQYKATLVFSKTDSVGTIAIARDGKPPAKEARKGDFVQWTANGKDQFAEPRRVCGFSDDGQWAFVEGSQTGIPTREIITVATSITDIEKPVSDKQAPPPNPFSNQDAPHPGAAEEKKVFDEGPAMIRWPDNLSKDSVKDFEYWVNGILRRLRRKAGLPADSK